MPTMTKVVVKTTESTIATAPTATYTSTGDEATVTLGTGWALAPGQHFSDKQVYAISGHDNGFEVPLGRMKYLNTTPPSFTKWPKR